MLAKDAVSYTGPRTTLDVSATFTEMLAIALLGAVSFVAAYELVLRRADRHTATVAGPDLDFGRATLLAIGLAALGIGSLAVFASAFLSDLRARTTRGETVTETFSRAASPSRLADSVLLGPDSEMAPTFAAALTVIPESLGHSYGKTIFGDLVVRPIPRPLWEGKPEPPRERLVATLWRSEREAGAINPEFSVLLYPYWDFGLIGVAIGLALAGAGCRVFYRYLGDRETETSAQVLYALAIWFVVIGLRNSPVDTLILAVFIVAPAWVVFRFARRDRGGIPNQPLPREGGAVA